MTSSDNKELVHGKERTKYTTGLGPFPPIFKDLAIKTDDIKTVFFYNSRPYGIPVGSNVECIPTRLLGRELRKVPGLQVPKKILDLRKWKQNGILHLTEHEFSKRDVYFIVRWLSLYKKDLMFVLIHPDSHLMMQYIIDSTDSSNIFVTVPSMNDSDIFNLINQAYPGRIDWSVV